MTNWIECKKQLPPEGTIVSTKIDDADGVRNEQNLILIGRMWYLSDQSMYIYYRPTHWKHVSHPSTAEEGKQ